MKRRKIAIYYRTSKKTKNNIRMQRKVCKKYSNKNKFKIVKEYIDYGLSGRTMKRPALTKLLMDLNNHKIDSVLVYKIDRLSRNFSHLNFIFEEFDENGIEILSATQMFDNTPEGRFMLRILTILSEFESDMTSNRIKDGLRAVKK